VGRRSRQRQKAERSSFPDAAPSTDYRDAEGNVLKLRGSLTASTRRQYAKTLAGGFNREDAWQRAAEFLFERLAVSWTISDVELTAQKELLARYRMATADERHFVRGSLREHLQENFPELEAP
jgi:hypothetical protein